SVTVTALDKFGNTATGYNGTLKVSSSDTQALLPGNYAFTAAVDQGVHVFSVIFQKAGSQTVTAQDLATTSLKAQATVSVTAGTPVQTGQAAGIGFWQSTNGQALIKGFNGGATSTGLSTWLAATFPRLYGSAAGGHNLLNYQGTGKAATNAQVAALYL